MHYSILTKLGQDSLNSVLNENCVDGGSTNQITVNIYQADTTEVNTIFSLTKSGTEVDMLDVLKLITKTFDGRVVQADFSYAIFNDGVWNDSKDNNQNPPTRVFAPTKTINYGKNGGVLDIKTFPVVVNDDSVNLQAKNYSHNYDTCEFVGCDFRYALFKDIIIQNTSFYNCTFNYANFYNVVFENCVFNNCSFMGSTLKCVNFYNSKINVFCNLLNSLWYQCKLDLYRDSCEKYNEVTSFELDRLPNKAICRQAGVDFWRGKDIKIENCVYVEPCIKGKTIEFESYDLKKWIDCY